MLINTFETFLIFSEKKFDETPNYFVDHTRNSQLRKKSTAMHHGIVTIPPLGPFNAMMSKISRSIQCNNMSSFIAIVLVDVNIIAIYEL